MRKGIKFFLMQLLFSLDLHMYRKMLTDVPSHNVIIQFKFPPDVFAFSKKYEKHEKSTCVMRNGVIYSD